MSVAK